jgi:hypothetical protein
MNFQKIDSELFEVESQSGHGTYVVDLKERTCTCPHYRYRGVVCKHIHAVEDNLPEKHEGENLIYEDIPPNFHYEEIY